MTASVQDLNLQEETKCLISLKFQRQKEHSFSRIKQ